ncbi:response regulator transcription factor [Vibrio algicola]|uniref:Response regulator n=1 Tax=Vibrio algicola TaxID=2662262 RepID=A0A5Q0TAB5_9VIBR|nr:LuxR C-terminal-related transcriptional regulator [Vibrio algicola]
MLDLPIYIVDDDDSVRDSLAFLLQELDYQIYTFSDGAQFLQQAKIAQPGCVLLDSRMPIMRGQQALQTCHIQHAFDSLTEREKEILRLIVQGMKNQQIADDLCIAVRTVEVHRSSLMKKFETKSITELVMQYSK